MIVKELVSKEEKSLLVDPTVLNVVFTVGTEQTITLPAVALSAGQFRIFKCTAASITVTIDGYGSETIDGQTSIALYDQYEVVRLYCDGSSWHIV